MLFVDDEPSVLEGLGRLLRRTPDLVIHTASSGTDALALLARQPIDVIISDKRMPGMDGEDLLDEVQRRHPAVRRFLLSGSILHGRDIGPHGLLIKPCSPKALLAAINPTAGPAEAPPSVQA